MASQLLKQNISIISADNIWNCHDVATDIAFIFRGDDKFIPTEVSRSTFVFISMFIVYLHFFVGIVLTKNLFSGFARNIKTV